MTIWKVPLFDLSYDDREHKAVTEVLNNKWLSAGPKTEEFESRIKTVAEYEHQADDLRKHIKTSLYAHALIPESRGDVLGLLENMDNLVDDANHMAGKRELQEILVKHMETQDRCGDSSKLLHRLCLELKGDIVL